MCLTDSIKCWRLQQANRSKRIVIVQINKKSLQNSTRLGQFIYSHNKKRTILFLFFFFCTNDKHHRMTTSTLLVFHSTFSDWWGQDWTGDVVNVGKSPDRMWCNTEVCRRKTVRLGKTAIAHTKCAKTPTSNEKQNTSEEHKCPQWVVMKKNNLCLRLFCNTDAHHKTWWILSRRGRGGVGGDGGLDR